MHNRVMPTAPEPPPPYDQRPATIPQARIDRRRSEGHQEPCWYPPPNQQLAHFSGQQVFFTGQQQPYQFAPLQPPFMMPCVSYQPSIAVAPIVIQPGALQNQPRWMAIPASIPGCPPGLEFLHGLRKIVIRQKQDMIEFMTGIEIPNRYSIETPTGDQIYVASEDEDFVQTQALGHSRGYRFKIFDAFNRVVFIVSRPLQYCSFGCCACGDGCKRKSTIEGAGEIFGSIQTRRACCSSSLTISDGNEKEVMTIDGPCYCSGYCSDEEFPLKSTTNGSILGRIKRKFRGFIYSDYSKADVFEIEFPADLSVRMKAALIGACIMIDFLEFEHTYGNIKQL